MDCISTYILVGLSFYGVCSFAQKKENTIKKDSVHSLSETFVNGFKPKEKLITNKTVSISTKELQRNSINLTETLRFNTPITFRDLGNGGVSTARFRGTPSTNTLVLWNGIPINPVGSGLVDFNSISASTTDQINIISGGSSSANGSGAIGGSIQFNDELKFKKQQLINLFSNYGAFNTTNNIAKIYVGNKKWTTKIASAVNYSDNDYEYLDSRFKDENGNPLKNDNARFRNFNVDISSGYQFSKLNKLFVYATYFEGERLFSAGIPNPSAGGDKIQDFNQRNLLKWQYQFSKFSQEVKLAYHSQEFRYFINKNSSDFNFGRANNWFVAYNLNYQPAENLDFTLLNTYESIFGKTDNGISKRRTLFSIGGFLNYAPLKSLDFTSGFRVEENSDFELPISFNLALTKRAFNKIKFKAQYSENYRSPTFNELFWPGLGNLNLVPETSKQYEVGFETNIKDVNINATYFNIDIKNQILWNFVTGGSNDAQFSNLQRPQNLKAIRNKGLEVGLKYHFKLNKNHLFELVSNYTRTIARNKENNFAIPFVPLHLINFNFDYSFWRINCFLQGLYQSKIYTTVDLEDFFSVDQVQVFNSGINLKLIQKENSTLSCGFKVNNINNEVYYFSNLRPTPGRNYAINLNYKFK